MGLKKRMLFILLVLFLANGVFAQAKPNIAVLSSDSPFYSGAAVDSKKTVGELLKGEPLVIVSTMDKRVSVDGITTMWYQLKDYSGRTGWLPGSRLFFSPTVFNRAAFSTERQYLKYLSMAGRVGEKLVATRNYERVKKGDIGYLVSVTDDEDDDLPISVVWEHNVAADPDDIWLPKGFPGELKPFVYFVRPGDVELLGEDRPVSLASLVKTLPSQFKQPDDFYEEYPDDDFLWYMDWLFYDYDYDYDDYDYGDNEYYYEGYETSGQFTVGTRVILGRHEYLNGSDNWVDEMEAYVGKRATITQLLDADDAGFLVARVDSNSFYWRIRNFALEGSAAEGSYGFEVGDYVILGAHRQIEGSDNWADEMDAYAGKKARITSIAGRDGAGCLTARVDIDGGEWVWRMENMTPAN